MKKVLSVLLAVLLSVAIYPPVHAEVKPIHVFYLGKEISFSVPPQMIKGNTMVPMRAIFETLGYQIDWNSGTKTVTAVKNAKTIDLTVGSQTAKVDGQSVKLTAPAVIIASSTMVPLRFVGENSGCDVLWDSANSCAYIENRNANDYDTVQKLGGSMGIGVGNCLMYADVDKHLYADLYMTTFDGKTSTRLLDGSAFVEEKKTTNQYAQAPYSYRISPYAPGKAVVCAENIDMFDVDGNTKATALLRKYLDDNLYGSNDNKVFGNYLYFEDLVSIAQNRSAFCLLQVDLKTDEKKVMFELPTAVQFSISMPENISDYTVNGNWIILVTSYSVGNSFKEHLYTFNMNSKILTCADGADSMGNVQTYQNSVYVNKDNKLYRFDPEKTEMTLISPENMPVSYFQILNDTVFYTYGYYGSNKKYREDFFRSPLNFSYQIKLSDKINYYWDVVGNHIIFKPVGNYETFMMNTDGTGAVMLRKTGRKYVDSKGTPVDDVPGIK